MATDPRSIDAALARAGWEKGAEALVAGWLEHRRSELLWDETRTPEDRTCYSSRSAIGTRYVIEYVFGDNWDLGVTWPSGWGHEHIRMGFLEDLKEEAEELAQADGPFGGPITPKRYVCAFPRERAWRIAGDIELRFELLRDNLAAYFQIDRIGKIEHLRVVPFDFSSLQKETSSLEDVPLHKPNLWADVQGKRHLWTFTAWRPLLARMSLGQRELLLACPDASTFVILAHTAGRLEAAVTLDSSLLHNLDTKWLAAARSWPNAVVRNLAPERASRSADSAPVSPPRPTTSSNSSSEAHPTSHLPIISPRSADGPLRRGFPGGDAVAPPVSHDTSSVGPPGHPRILKLDHPPSTQPKISPPSTSSPAAPAQTAPTSLRSAASPSSPTATAEPTPSAPSTPSSATAVEIPPSPTDSPAEAASSPASSSTDPSPRTTEAASASPTASSPHPIAEDAPEPPRTAEAELHGDPPAPTHRKSRPKPQFPLSEGSSPMELEHHFAEIEAAIPPKLTGAATAVAIWQATREAHRHGALPITGGWIDLVSTLHRRGWLPHLPGDRATREALSILERLSPLVRRLHHRRWVLGVER